MRIVIVAPGLGPCGGARVIVELATRLKNRGHMVAVTGPGIQPGWIHYDFPIVPVHTLVNPTQPYDVVMATGYQTVVPAMSLPAARKFYYVQMLEHLFYAEGSPGWREAQNTYPVAQGAGFNFITIATWQQEALQREWSIEAEMIPVAVNREHFYPDGPKQSYILIEGDNRNAAKDVQRLAWQVGEVLRHVYGVGLHGYAAYQHSHAHIFDRFVIKPNEAQMRQLYSGALFLLKASKYEGRAGAVSEAMVCGTTCARAIVEGDEDVIDGYTGLRVGYEYGPLLNAAMRLMEDVRLRRQLEQNCLDYTRSHLLWEPVIDLLEAAFQS
jgi:glycosyltransferase involved in cell wall biosynthesis